MLNALDITVQERSSPVHRTLQNSNLERTGITLETVNTDLTTTVTVEDAHSTNLNPTMEGEHHTEESLWIKATDMMGDLDSLGLKLKNEVELAVKSLTAKQQSDSQKITGLSRTVEDYQSEVNSLKLNISALQAVADETREDLASQLQRKDEEHKTIVLDLQSKISVLDSQVSDLKSQNGELALELQSTKESLHSTPHSVVDISAIESIKNELTEKNEELDKLQIEIQILTRKNEEQAKTITSLEDEQAKLSSTLLEKDSDISDLQEKLQTTEDTYGGQISILEKQLAETQLTLSQESNDKYHYLNQVETAIAKYETLHEKYKNKKKENDQLEQALENAKKTSGTALTPAQLKYYQELERKYVQAKK